MEWTGFYGIMYLTASGFLFFFFVMEIGTDVSGSDGLKNQLGRAQN